MRRPRLRMTNLKKLVNFFKMRYPWCDHLPHFYIKLLNCLWEFKNRSVDSNTISQILGSLPIFSFIWAACEPVFIKRRFMLRSTQDFVAFCLTLDCSDSFKIYDCATISQWKSDSFRRIAEFEDLFSFYYFSQSTVTNDWKWNPFVSFSDKLEVRFRSMCWLFPVFMRF